MGEGDRRPPGLVQVQMLRACGCLLDLWEVVQCGRGLHLPMAEEVQGQDDHEHTGVERGGDEQGDQRHQHSQAVSGDGVRGLGPTPAPTPTLASASTLSWKVAGRYFRPGLTPEGQTSLLPNAGAVHTNCPIYTSRAMHPTLPVFQSTPAPWSSISSGKALLYNLEGWVVGECPRLFFPLPRLFGLIPALPYSLQPVYFFPIHHHCPGPSHLHLSFLPLSIVSSLHFSPPLTSNFPSNSFITSQPERPFKNSNLLKPFQSSFPIALEINFNSFSRAFQPL